MNNTFRIVRGVSVRKYATLITIIKKDETNILKTSLDEDDFKDIKNFMLSCYEHQPGFNISEEEAIENIGNIFNSKKNYTYTLKKTPDNYLIIDILVLSVHASLQPFFYGGLANRGIKLINPTQGYGYLKITHLLNFGNYNSAHGVRVGESVVFAGIPETDINNIYSQIIPSCATEERFTFYDRLGRDRQIHLLSLVPTPKDAFHPDSKEGIKGYQDYRYKRILIAHPDFSRLSIPWHKRPKLDFWGQTLIISDCNDFFEEKYKKPILKIIDANPYVRFISFKKYFTKETEPNPSFELTRSVTFHPSCFILNSVPIEFVTEINERSEPSCLFCYNLNIQIENRWARMNTSKITFIPNGKLKGEVTVVHEKGKDHMKGFLDLCVKYMGTYATPFKKEEFISEENYIQYIKTIKDFCESNSTITHWLDQCRKQAGKNRLGLINNYKRMKRDLLLEEAQIKKFLRQNDFSKQLPVPSLRIEGFSKKNIKNQVRFRVAETLFSGVGRIHIPQVCENTSFAQTSKKMRGCLGPSFEREILKLYNKENNEIFINRKIMEVIERR